MLWLAQLQRVQDLLSQYHQLSLVVLDSDCTELTVPSGLPAECGSADPTHSTTCWRMRREAIDRVRSSRRPAPLPCPRGRSCYVSPLGIAPDDYESPCRFFLAGSGPPRAAPAAQLVQELFRLIGPSTPPPEPPHKAVATRELPLGNHSKSPLTQREREILGLIGAGLSNREIALKLFVCEATVKTHITHLLQKLGLANRTEAALYAMRESILPATSPAGQDGWRQR